ncbi:unnamed protein product [Didymodactylos carnosus]|uniref:NAD(P)(+)--arginine ADP-ribosyltransferase n=1 Tax=Didymodactylos carnosus TaxID=1234261 RepID=A0A814PQZ8_9BILA|nr:unnamed protein product [Didymodactylos carnosus]CAF3873889.1 unnamed protein product [Didymodactylos carnosus]
MKKKKMTHEKEIPSATVYDVREERFCYPEKSHAKSFKDGKDWGSDFINEWCLDYHELVSDDRYSEIVEQAANGILCEGKLLNQEFNAQQLADRLMEVKNNKCKEIRECAARLYSAESFLYKLINTVLRADDKSKVDTLGAYCYLLDDYLMNSNDHGELTVYRGCTLTDEMIAEYKHFVGKWISWLAFTSTTKAPQVAEMFSRNTLFIIHIRDTSQCYKCDISSLSQFTHEQEVLLTAAHYFYVTKIKRDRQSQKYLIYLTSL